ncbi:hypothetical protein CLOM_g18958 [Closterium sp. NIES-68]|nr:hypothetical protein CLOM_g18958 [Closterium sp. NIES-68]GJP78389.1 hypothetical protein CLOP_g8693 [Closterium sp. NIES-67]
MPLTGQSADARRHQQLQQQRQRHRPWLSVFNRQWLSVFSPDVAWSRLMKAVGRRLESPNRPAVKSAGYYDGWYGSLAGVALISTLIFLLVLLLRHGFPSSASRAANLIDPDTLAATIERHGPYIDSEDISAAQSWPSALDDLPPVHEEGSADGEGDASGDARVERGLHAEEQRAGERKGGGEAERGDVAACETGGAGCPYSDIVVRAKGPLHSRMEAVCAGYAISQLLSMKLSPPIVDAVGVPHPNSSSAAAGAASAGSGGGSVPGGSAAAGAGLSEEGVRQLRLAVLWLPDSGVWDAHYDDLFQPLPLSPSLPEDHDPSHHDPSHHDPSHQDPPRTASHAASGGTVLMLHEKPPWLRSPLYVEGRLDLDIVPAPPQPQQQPQQQPPRQPPRQPQPQHNPHNVQQAPWLVEPQPAFPTQRPHRYLRRRRRLLSTGSDRRPSQAPGDAGEDQSAYWGKGVQQRSSRLLTSARLLLPSEEPEGQETDHGEESMSTPRRRLAEAAAGGGKAGSTSSASGTRSSASAGGSAGGSGVNTVTVSLHLQSWLRHVATSMDVAPNSEESMELQSSMVECYSMLQPSATVKQLVERENLTHVRQSTAVYMEPVQSACTGCDPKLLPNCTARRLMWLYLAHPSTPTTLSAFWPSQALAVAHTFHPSRQPHLLRTTLHRSEHCRPNPQRGELTPPPIVPHPWTPKEVAERRHKAEIEKNQSRADVAAADVAVSVASRKDRTVWLDKLASEHREEEKRQIRGNVAEGGEGGSGVGAGGGGGGGGGGEGEGGGEGGSVSLIAGGDGADAAALGGKGLKVGGLEAIGGETEGAGEARREQVLDFLKRMYGPGMGASKLGRTEGEQRRQIRAMLKELMGRDWKGVLEEEEAGEKEGEGNGEGEGGKEGERNVFSLLGKRRLLQSDLKQQQPQEGGIDEQHRRQGTAEQMEAGSMREWEDLNVKERSIRCTQMEASELFALTHASRLIHLQQSPQADFIQAQATARSVQEASEAAGAVERRAEDGVKRGERGGVGWMGAMAEGVEREEEVGFVREEGICHAPATKPITKHRIGHQLIVDENIGLLYCWVPKVACTSWKVWIRQQHHDTHSNDLLSTHRPFASNISEVWYALNEPDAIRAITRPDLLKFVFVRQPFARIVSAYLNKHVAGGGPDGWGRKFWNLNFFGHLAYFRQMNNRTGGNFTFPEFVRLVEYGMRFDRRKNMDNHLAPQSLLCGLDRIKYDFVGRFENMEEDVKHIMRRLGREPGDAFDFGKKIHPTKSRDQMLKLYSDAATYFKVKSTYRSDMDEPFNGIHYDPPPELSEKFEPKSAGQA